MAHYSVSLNMCEDILKSQRFIAAKMEVLTNQVSSIYRELIMSLFYFSSNVNIQFEDQNFETEAQSCSTVV